MVDFFVSAPPVLNEIVDFFVSAPLVLEEMIDFFASAPRFLMKYWCFRLLGSFFPTSILKHFPSPRLMFCNTYNGILLFSRSSAHGKHNFGVHINKNTIKTNKNYTGEAKIPGKLSKTKPPKNTQFHTWRGMSNYHIKNRLFFLTMKIPSPALVDQ